MKIKDILSERGGFASIQAPNDATAKVKKYVQNNKPELNQGQDEKVGGTIGKIAAGSLARDTNVAAQRERSVGLDAFGGKGADVSKPAVAKPKKDVSIDRGDPALWDAPVAKTTKASTPMDAGEFSGTPVAKPKVAATSTPKRARSALPSASTSTVSGSARNQQAQAKFNQRQPSSVAKTTKKPTGTVGGGLSDKTLNDRK